MTIAKMTDVVMLFFRDGMFYPVQFSDQCTVEDHVKLNPGTNKVVNAATGKTVWEATKQ
jgi:hypothetical protein